MSLKDEIERLIRTEQAKLEERDKKHEKYHERQKMRFAPLRAVLKEIVDSIDPNYIEARFTDWDALIKFGFYKW